MLVRSYLNWLFETGGCYLQLAAEVGFTVFILPIEIMLYFVNEDAMKDVQARSYLRSLKLLLKLLSS